MKKLLTIVCFFIMSFTNVEAKYVKLPDNSYYKIPTGKYEGDASFWFCFAYSKYPNAYSLISPSNQTCGNDFYIKFKEIYFEQNNQKELILEAVPLLQNGDWILNNKKLSGNAMFCDAYTQASQTKENIEYQKEKAFFCNTNSLVPAQNIQTNTNQTSKVSTFASISNNEVNTGQAFIDALTTVALRIVLIVGIFYLLTIGVTVKNLNKPSHNGRWWGALLGSMVAVLLMFKNPQPTYSNSWLEIIIINFVLFYVIGFFIAYAWKLLHNKSIKKSAIVNDESLWAMALSEVDNERQQKALWARCFAEANGNNEKAKAMYIKERVWQLKQKI